jgi:GT2 family glycosyltransferase
VPPTVSVVVPTYNRLPQLEHVLAALANQTYAMEQLQLVVVSDGSTDGTEEYLRSCPFDLIVASQPNGGPATARNRGVELADGSLILFVDDDVVAAPWLVEQHVLSHENGDYDLVVIGPMLTPPAFDMSPWVEWEQAMLYRQYDAMKRGIYEATFRQFYTGNASLRKSCLMDVGGFDTRFRRAEDVELAYRLRDAGMRFAFNPDAIGYHYADRSYDSWLKNAYDYGRNDIVFSRREGREWLLSLVRHDFHQRHLLIRAATRACVADPMIDRLTRAFLRGLITASASHAPRVTRLALSGLYNLVYYQGVAHEVGSPNGFRDLMAGSLPSQGGITR